MRALCAGLLQQRRVDMKRGRSVSFSYKETSTVKVKLVTESCERCVRELLRVRHLRNQQHLLHGVSD